MGKVTSTPLLFQSKLVCFSLLYLFTSLFLALYTSLSQTKCLFRSSPFDPIQTPLFSYPPNYGEHKYAIPTQRKSCSSRVYFSGALHFFFLKLNIGIWLFFCGFWQIGFGFCAQIIGKSWRRSKVCAILRGSHLFWGICRESQRLLEEISIPKIGFRILFITMRALKFLVGSSRDFQLVILVSLIGTQASYVIKS